MEPDLFDAVEKHDLSKLARLLDGGGDPNSLDPRQPGWTLLKAAISEASEGGPIDGITLLLRRGATVDLTGTVGNTTPMIVAVHERNLEAVRLLLSSGANLTMKDDEGDFPLILSVQLEDLSIARLLLLCGAASTVNRTGTPAGMLPLSIAVGRLNPQMVSLLLNMGADPEMLDDNRLGLKGYLPHATKKNNNARDEVLNLLASHRIIKETNGA